MIYSLLVNLLWIVFILYWFITGLKAKKNVRRNWRWIGMRLVLVLALYIALSSSTFDSFAATMVTTSSAVKSIGVIMTAVGISLAIWARVYLGRNWGMPMSLKQDPELVTEGPYKYIRHPIYTGALFAMLGTVLVNDIGWIIPFVVFLIYFIYSATQEEKNLTKQFPDHYSAYKEKTKMLIPFLF